MLPSSEKKRCLARSPSTAIKAVNSSHHKPERLLDKSVALEVRSYFTLHVMDKMEIGIRGLRRCIRLAGFCRHSNKPLRGSASLAPAASSLSYGRGGGTSRTYVNWYVLFRKGRQRPSSWITLLRRRGSVKTQGQNQVTLAHSGCASVSSDHLEIHD